MGWAEIRPYESITYICATEATPCYPRFGVAVGSDSADVLGLQLGSFGKASRLVTSCILQQHDCHVGALFEQDCGVHSSSVGILAPVVCF